MISDHIAGLVGGKTIEEQLERTPELELNKPGPGKKELQLGRTELMLGKMELEQRTIVEELRSWTWASWPWVPWVRHSRTWVSWL
jgi:hypothetical protein